MGGYSPQVEMLFGVEEARKDVTIDDRRQYVRKSLHSTVSVFERNTNQYIGMLADYSRGGFMVASTVKPLQVGQHCECMLLVQNSLEACATRVAVDADCAWCEETSPSFFGIGFRVGNISEEAMQVLESCAD